MKFDEEFDVVVAVIRKGDRILITKRKRGSFMCGRWEFPGGKVECDEDYEQALVREIFEEIGVKIKIINLFHLNHHVYDLVGGKKRKVLLVTYEAEIIEGKIQCIGVQEYKWISPKELEKYDFVEGDLPIIKRLLGR